MFEIVKFDICYIFIIIINIKNLFKCIFKKNLVMVKIYLYILEKFYSG